MLSQHIGVTGVKTKDEVLRLSKSFKIAFSEYKKLKLMISVLVRDETLDGKKETNHLNRYPKVTEISNIFSDDSVCLNFIRYKTRTTEESLFVNELVEATKYGGRNLNGIQLDIAWPSSRNLFAYRDLYPKKKIILQIGKEALESVTWLPSKLAEKLKQYKGLIDAVLLDWGEGEGIEMQSDMAKDYIDEILCHCSWLNVGVSGGLGNNMELINDILMLYKEISINAGVSLMDDKGNLSGLKVTTYFADTMHKIAGYTPY